MELNVFRLFCNCDREFKLLKQWIVLIDRKLEIIMGALENANAKLEVLEGVVTDLSGDVDALLLLAEDLKKQVANGQVNMALAEQIEAKATALSERLGGVDAKIEEVTGKTPPTGGEGGGETGGEGTGEVS